MREQEIPRLPKLSAIEDTNEGSSNDTIACLVAILNATPDAFLIIDECGKIELINETAESMFLYPKQELLGQNVSMLMPDSYRKARDSDIFSYVASGESAITGKGRKLRARKANGEEFPVFITVGEVEQSSHSQFVGVIRDISAEEHCIATLAESQARLLQATRLSSMGELASGIAHEINQPLSAISSYAQASKRMLNSPDTDHTEVISQTLDKICEQALRANDVINRLRAIVKKHIPQRQRVELVPLIRESIKLAKLDARLLDHEIVLELNDCQEIELFADPIQIQQVLLNLIHNASDAMSRQERSSVVIRCRSISNETIEIAVVDSGKGIDEQTALHIFTPFFTNKVNGVGMGLNVCQTIVHAHGGHIQYVPNRPKGCIFTFCLPTFTAYPPEIKEPHGNTTS